jgi:hypothetical protein
MNYRQCPKSGSASPRAGREDRVVLRRVAVEHPRLHPATFHSYQVRALAVCWISAATTGSEHAVRFYTAAPPRAGLQMPFQPAVMRIGGPQQFYVTYRNVRRAEVELSQLTPLPVRLVPERRLEPVRLPTATPTSSGRAALSSRELNQVVLEPLTPQGADGGRSAGFLLLQPRHADIPPSLFTLPPTTPWSWPAQN